MKFIKNNSTKNIIAMTDNNPTKLTLESYGSKIQWESPYENVSMEDLLYAFYGLCVTATWSPKTILEEMKDFAEERLKFMGNKGNDEATQHTFYPHNSFLVPRSEYGTSVSSKDYSDSITYTTQN